MDTLARPCWVEIDLGAVAHNVALARGLVGEHVRIYGVCKADAMGCGLVPIARTYADSGVDALAVADPADVVTLRDAGLTLPILLFASTLPEQAADVAALDVIPVVHDLPSLAAFAGLGRPIDVFFKIDCGMGRLGFTEHRWDDAFARAAAAPTLNLTGLYTHMSNPSIARRRWSRRRGSAAPAMPRKRRGSTGSSGSPRAAGSCSATRSCT